jgi:hypothetical protein
LFPASARYELPSLPFLGENKMNLIYIGQEFYVRSSTFMSSIYEVDDYGNIVRRSDWGHVQRALQHGQEVNIIPADKIQMVWAYDKLNDILEKQKSK